jgi:hypothetical protein
LCSWKIVLPARACPADSIVSFAQPLVTTVITGAKSMDQLRDNMHSTRVHLMSPTADTAGCNEPNGAAPLK